MSVYTPGAERRVSSSSVMRGEKLCSPSRPENTARTLGRTSLSFQRTATAQRSAEE